MSRRGRLLVSKVKLVLFTMMYLVRGLQRWVFRTVGILLLFSLAGCGSGSEKILTETDEVMLARGYGLNSAALIHNIIAHRADGKPAGIHPHVAEMLNDPMKVLGANELVFTPISTEDAKGAELEWEAPDDLPGELQKFLTECVERLLAVKALLVSSRSTLCCDFSGILDGLSNGELFNPALETLVITTDREKLDEAVGSFVAAVEFIHQELEDLHFEDFLEVAPRSFTSPIGQIRIADTRNNSHKGGSGVILDLGGDDEYQRVPTRANEISLVIDVDGNDRYSGVDISLGGLVLITDVAGDDRYFTPGAGLAATVGGLSWLHDHAGNDQYFATEFGIAAAVGGFGALVDVEGNDEYHVKGYGQGFGGPAGFGKLEDLEGNDGYFSASSAPHLLDRKGEKLSYVQGVGIGYRPRLAGGIGVLRDSSGNDSYFAEKFAQGQGYFFGFGMLEDTAGNDTYTSSRYAQGQGSFAGIGLLADLDGEDDYRLEVGVGQGMGLDVGIGVLADHAGDDRYAAPNLAQGSSTGNGFGLLADAEGTDVYYLDKPGLGWGRGRDARGMPGLPFLLDIGGKAHYILSGELMLDVDPEGLGGPLASFKLSQPTRKKFECPDPKKYAAPMVGSLIDRLSRSAPRFGLDVTALQEFVGLGRLMPNAMEGLFEQVKAEDSDLVVNLSALVRCYLEDASESEKIKIQHMLIKTLRSDHALALVAITLLRIIPPSSDILFDISERSQHHSDCGVRASALLLLRYVNGTTERVKSLARRSLQDSCWQVKSVCLSLLAHFEGTSPTNVSRVTFNELPDVLKHRAKVSTAD